MKDEFEFYMQYSDTVEVSSMTKTDLKNLIQTGESSFLEFKHSVASPEKIAREMAAFANTKGGTLLIGVEDNGEMLGLEAYHEEEFWINQAARDECIPAIEPEIELLNVGERDILIVKIHEAETKPIYVKGKNHRQVFVRLKDESVVASDELVEVLKQNDSDEGVTFEYGEKEQQLFRFLNEYGEITVERYSLLVSLTTYSAAKILVNLVSAGVLDLFEKDGVAHYTFSQKTS
ncbi:AlbA family DNA-binding domain-containing protein [Gracilimonas mengyeensis]|uniref:DNA-binding domain-containing protein n=1 Tax=Gracilimonas mengyeensis TaxID=1302730 RepID=A0A521DCT8_9BACT|nr:ATP-binding protein [Gracilimonas mengyeensis]SMO69624.1 Putative DNA-binding domain-containing protein [Gracilimonas mengyeensis]